MLAMCRFFAFRLRGLRYTFFMDSAASKRLTLMIIFRDPWPSAKFISIFPGRWNMRATGRLPSDKITVNSCSAPLRAGRERRSLVIIA